MILAPPGGIAGDAVHHAGDTRHGDREPASLGAPPQPGVPWRLAGVDEAAGQAPLAEGRGPAALDEQHAVAVEADRADADARLGGILAAPRGPASHSAVAYFSSTSRAACAVSSAVRPSALRRRPCSRSKAWASAAATSSNFGRWPSAASSVVRVASGSRVVGKSVRRRGASTPSRIEPCWTKHRPCRRWALPTTLRAAISIDRKSTRLNSSHGYISYAVFCLKKKK